MAGFKVELQTAGPHVVGDLGLTITGAISSIYDLTQVAPQEIARSADLQALVSGGDLLVVDTRDDSDATIMSLADSLQAITNHNDTHFGISGGRFGALDDPTATITDNFIVQYDSGSDSYESQSPEVLLQDFSDTIGAIVGGMGVDGTDTTYNYDPADNFLIGGGIQDETNYDASTNNGTFAGGSGYVVADTITLSDGSVVTVDAEAAGVITGFTVTTSGGTNVTEGVALTQSSTSGGGSGFTLTPENNNTTEGTHSWSVNDVFLRNTGDTLDSGTLTIASGAAVSFPAGSSLTIDGAVTAATIATPGGGFTGDTDIINKAYVDQVASGLDWKESARVSTSPADGDITGGSFGGVYAAGGGPAGTGEFTSVDLSAGTGDTIDGLNFTGTASTGLVIGDRVLIKDQTDATQNGIYEITAAPTADDVTLTRATDQDGTPASEVSGGNTVFIEDTTAINSSSVNSNTTWVVLFDGTIALNTDDIDWTQVAGPGSFITRDGLSRDGVTIDIDLDDLTSATVVGADEIAFHDADGAANSSGSQTRKTTVTNFLSDLDIVNGITTNGIIVRTADDTYASRTITAATTALEGIVITNGDGVAGNPTVGIDIQNRTARSDAVDTSNDLVLVWNDSAGANEAYTIGDIAGALASVNSFETWAGGGNTTGDGSIVADSATDTANLTGGDGINIDLTAATDTITFSFTRAGLTNTATVAADTVPFFDASNSDSPEFRSWSDIISDLGILTGATPYWTTQALTGNTAGDASVSPATSADTLTWNGGDGITLTGTDATDTIDITFSRAGMADTAVVGADTVPFFDASATNQPEFRSWTNIISDLGLLTSGATNYWGNINTTGNTAGDTTPAASPDTSDDTLTFNGGIGITLTGTAASDTLSWAFSNAGMADTVITTTDTIPFFDASNSDEPEFRSMANILADLDIPNGITGNGIVVRTAADTYTNRSIDASTNEDELGIAITNGDGVTGNPTVGLDIVGLTDPNADMAATDEFAVHDKSEGTGGANRKMTGQNIADGVAAILGLNNDLGFSTINGQTILTYTDPSRSKTLSVESHPYQYSDNSVGDGGWVEIGNATDADAGWIMPFDGTIVACTAMSENPGAGNTYELDLFINGSDSGAVATLSGAGVDTDTDVTLDIDFSQGDRLRIQGDQTAGTTAMGDTTVMLYVRWRA